MDATHSAEERARRLAEQVKAEMREDLEAYNAYVLEHGSPADLVRGRAIDAGDAA